MAGRENSQKRKNETKSAVVVASPGPQVLGIRSRSQESQMERIMR